MRMRGWGVLLVFWLGALILGSQAFAASQTLRQKQAVERRAARSLIAAEVARLSGDGPSEPDSTRHSVEAEGEVLVLEVVRGPVEAGGQAVRLRVLNRNGVRLREHGVWIDAPAASQEQAARVAGTDAAPAGGASVAGGSASSSPPVPHRPAAGAVLLSADAAPDRLTTSSH